MALLLSEEFRYKFTVCWYKYNFNLYFLSWALRGAKRHAQCFALAKHSSEVYYWSGQNYFSSGYLTIWHWLKYAFNAWFLRTYLANWEKVEISAWCQIGGNFLICVTFFSVIDTLYDWDFTIFWKKRFSGFRKQSNCYRYQGSP